MCIETKQQDQFLIATCVAKRLDAALAPKFKDKMKEIIDSGRRIIILDLSQTDFIDSSGLGAIVVSLKLLGGKGDFMLCGATGAVASLFKLTRMDKVFPMYATVADAIKAQQ